MGIGMPGPLACRLRFTMQNLQLSPRSAPLKNPVLSILTFSGLATLLALTSSLSAAPPIKAHAADASEPQPAPRRPQGLHAHKGDSLYVLEMLLRSEMKPDSRVLLLKNGTLADSLMRFGARGDLGAFENRMGDSALAREIKTQEEFRAYWKQAEGEEGITALKRQYEREDIDKTLIPKLYLFDSSVVVYPGWIILRKKR